MNVKSLLSALFWCLTFALAQPRVAAFITQGKLSKSGKLSQSRRLTFRRVHEEATHRLRGGRAYCPFAKV